MRKKKYTKFGRREQSVRDGCDQVRVSLGMHCSPSLPPATNVAPSLSNKTELMGTGVFTWVIILTQRTKRHATVTQTCTHAHTHTHTHTHTHLPPFTTYFTRRARPRCYLVKLFQMPMPIICLICAMIDGGQRRQGHGIITTDTCALTGGMTKTRM